MSCVAPPPRLPHPAASPFAVPTILLLNMELIQNWHDTNVARENPMKNRTAMNPPASETSAMEYTAGEMIMIRNAQPYRGPMMSHTVPIRRRDNTEPGHTQIAKINKIQCKTTLMSSSPHIAGWIHNIGSQPKCHQG